MTFNQSSSFTHIHVTVKLISISQCTEHSSHITSSFISLHNRCNVSFPCIPQIEQKPFDLCTLKVNKICVVLHSNCYMNTLYFNRILTFKTIVFCCAGRYICIYRYSFIYNMFQGISWYLLHNLFPVLC